VPENEQVTVPSPEECAAKAVHLLNNADGDIDIDMALVWAILSTREYYPSSIQEVDESMEDDRP